MVTHLTQRYHYLILAETALTSGQKHCAWKQFILVSKKQVSNNASIEYYQSVIERVKEYQNAVFCGIEFNNCKLASPPKNNISDVQDALLEASKKVMMLAIPLLNCEVLMESSSVLCIIIFKNLVQNQLGLLLELYQQKIVKITKDIFSLFIVI